MRKKSSRRIVSRVKGLRLICSPTVVSKGLLESPKKLKYSVIVIFQKQIEQVRQVSQRAGLEADSRFGHKTADVQRAQSASDSDGDVDLNIVMDNASLSYSSRDGSILGDAQIR